MRADACAERTYAMWSIPGTFRSATNVASPVSSPPKRATMDYDDARAGAPDPGWSGRIVE